MWPCRSPMRTSGSSGCAIPTCRTRSISSPFTFCPIGRISRSRRPAPPLTRRHPQAGRCRVSRQGHPDRRIRLAERGPHARARAAFALEPGARMIETLTSRGRAYQGQYHRGFRSALEACARRRRRWLLGHHRPLHGGPNSAFRRHYLRSSALALAGGRRHCAWRRFPSARLLGRRGKEFPPSLAGSIGALAFVPAVLFGWTIETVLVESFSLGSWLARLPLRRLRPRAGCLRRGLCSGPRRSGVRRTHRPQRRAPDFLDWALGGILIA